MERAGIDEGRVAIQVLSLLAALASACGGVGTGTAADAGVDRHDGAAGEAAPSPAAFYACGASFTTTLDRTIVDPATPGAAIHAHVSLRDLEPLDRAMTHPLRVAIVREGAEARVLLDTPDARPGKTFDLVWDATLGGAAVPVGAYALRTSYGCGGAKPLVVDHTIAAVHLGAVAVTIANGDGLYQPLLWHELAQIPKNYWSPAPTAPVLVRGGGKGAADLTLPDGTRRPYPPMATDLGSPPMDASGQPATADYDLPFGLSSVTHPDVTLMLAREAPPWDARPSPESPPVGRIDVRARLLEASAPADVLVEDGYEGTYRFTTPPAPAVGRYDLSLHLVFDFRLPDASWTPIATETIPLRAYGLVGPQTIAPGAAAPYIPWVAVVDAVAGWVGGTTADPDAVATLVVHHVYDDLGLHYDTVSGADYYTTYAYGFGGATFDLTSFLTRANGSTVNCTDCASIVSTYANMVGCDLGYNILLSDFALDYIKAIGTPAFTNDPFNTGSPGGFSYHAITSNAATRVFDATLHEDGDADPAAPPFLDTEVDGLAQSFYLAHLSPAALTVSHDDKTAIE